MFLFALFRSHAGLMSACLLQAAEGKESKDKKTTATPGKPETKSATGAKTQTSAEVRLPCPLRLHTISLLIGLIVRSAADSLSLGADRGAEQEDRRARCSGDQRLLPVDRAGRGPVAA